MTPLLLVGAGGFAREAAEAVHAMNAANPTFDLLGFVDDDPALAGRHIGGVRVLGPVELASSMTDAQIVVCTGNPADYTSRRRLVERLAVSATRYATIVHPAAIVPRAAEIGPGTVVLAAVVLTCGIRVGAHVALMPGVVLTHDDVVADYATFGSGVRLAGGVHVGEGAYLGAGALVREHRTIGAWSLLGMGSVLTKDLPEAEVWAGVPARKVRSALIPSEFLRRATLVGGPDA